MSEIRDFTPPPARQAKNLLSPVTGGIGVLEGLQPRSRFLFLVGLSLSGEGRQLTGDQPCATAISHPGPHPVQKYRGTAAKADQKKDVDNSPDDPSDKTGEPDPAKIGNRRVSPDRGKRALVAIAETRGHRVAAHTAADQLADIASLLL